jgi:hypothetical protein
MVMEVLKGEEKRSATQQWQKVFNRLYRRRFGETPPLATNTAIKVTRYESYHR